MADATNRKLVVGDTATDEISRDDPLFELSQIIGYKQPEETVRENADASAADEQLDLEDALVRELEGEIASMDEADDGPLVAETAPISAPPLDYSQFDDEAGASDGDGDELEDELLALLGGLGEKAHVDWEGKATPRRERQDSAPASDESATVEDAADMDTAESDSDEQAEDEDTGFFTDASSEGQLHREPAEADAMPDEEDARAILPEEPDTYDFADDAFSDNEANMENPEARAQDDIDDSAIFDAFEDALKNDLAIAFDDAGSGGERAENAVSDETAEIEDDLDLDIMFEETDDLISSAAEMDTGAFVDDLALATGESDEAPELEMAEMPASDIEPMQPLDLPVLPSVENSRSGQLDIERELDAALAGFDQYEQMHPEPQTTAVAATVATGVAASTDARLDFDMGAFEDDLARDLEFVGHDMMTAPDEGANADYSGEMPEDPGQPKQRRGMMIAAVVGGIAILGAIGVFALNTGGTGEDTGPVLVKADPEPVKIVPEDPGGKQVPNQDRAVYGEVDGNGKNSPAQETLVSTSEEPIDLSGGSAPPLPNGVAETAKVEDRLSPDEGFDPASEPSPEQPAAIAPRRVRTVIVKPDGTFMTKPIEPAATTPAVAAATPAEPVVTAPAPEPVPVVSEPAPEVPAIEIVTAQPAAEEIPTPVEPEVAVAPEPETTTADTAALEAAAKMVPAGATEEVAEAAAPPAATARRLPTPEFIPERPSAQPVTIVNEQQQAAQAPRRASNQQAPVEQAPAEPVVQQPVPGGYSVQIASLPTAEMAQTTVTNLTQRFSGVLGGRAISIQQAEIEGRGTFHRVRVAASDRADAIALCESYKSAGGNCFVTR
jgi:SPOR domain